MRKHNTNIDAASNAVATAPKSTVTTVDVTNQRDSILRRAIMEFLEAHPKSDTIHLILT